MFKTIIIADYAKGTQKCGNIVEYYGEKYIITKIEYNGFCDRCTCQLLYYYLAVNTIIEVDYEKLTIHDYISRLCEKFTL